MDERDLAALRDAPVPEPGPGARERALQASLAAFSEQRSTQGSGAWRRLKSVFNPQRWRWTMQRRMALGAAAASFAVVAIAAQFSLERGLISFGGAGLERRTDPAIDKAAGTEEPVARNARSEQFEVGAPPGAGAGRDGVAGERAERDAVPEQEAVAANEVGASGLYSTGGTVAPVSPPTGFELGAAGEVRRQFHDAARFAAPMSASEPTPALPPELTGRDRFSEFDANPVHTVAEDPVSTFSIDVDTASYAFVRRMLREGRLPPEDVVRVEEMVNYFDYGYQPPASADEPFRPTVAVFPTPWNAETRLVRIGIKGHEVVPGARRPANLVFLIDVSGSMQSADKLALLKSAFRLLLDSLEPEDTVSIVTYAGEAGTALEPTRVSERREILDAIDGLGAGGSTAGAAGIEAAYDLAADAFVDNGVNRVILATDGDFNVGMSEPGALEDYIARKRASGIYLSVLGFGAGNYNDALMQALAQSGNGNAAYIDTLNEARKVLVEEAGSTLVPIAGDVKIQVEFNPATVAEYRLIGYETRALAREDFNNDRVDAGDIGSGHTVTALYELTPAGSPARLVDDLRYQREEVQAVAGPGEEYAYLRLRYKLPGESTSRLIERAISTADERRRIETADDDMRFAAAVAAFGQKLRGGTYIGDYGYDDIAILAQGARGDDPFGYRNEFLSLVRLAAAIDRPSSRR